jgi:signal transduction histidine kinase/response regulator of citrate/malate metabolism
MADDDEFVTLIDDAGDAEGSFVRPWKVAVIDDDPAVHEGTRFALHDYSLYGQGVELLAAHSAAQGRELLRANPDVAVVMLDVVMETDTAGLDLVGFIRRELKNETVRIILRTGQPGQAPERSVIVDYDINDYKAKTELTADKLFTSLTAALRSYQQIQRMVETRRGLEIIIDAASELFDCRSIQRLAEGVLTQIACLLNVECVGILVLRDGGRPGADFSILAASGCYSHVLAAEPGQSLDPELQATIQEAFRRRHHEFQPNRSVLYMLTGSGREVVVLLEAARHLSDTDRALVEVFCSRFSIAFDNAILYEQLQLANAELEQRVAQRTRELTAANQRLATQTARLRRENAFKSEILGTVAHDLKNPLGVILGRTEIMTELIARAQGTDERLVKQVGHIRETADDLTAMIDTLIADAMTDALDISLRRELTDLSALVREVVDANRPLADRKQQTIVVAAPANHLASCDPDRVREAIDNLLSNAIKYSPTGGRIELEVELDKAGTVIRVKDNGAGLSPEDLSRLFGRFQRLSAKPTAGESSTGLGLSIAKRIVDLHGGRIGAESPGPGLGTTFMMIFPVHPAHP